MFLMYYNIYTHLIVFGSIDMHYIFLFLVPNEINSTASINPLNSYYEVGSNITLTCSISYHKQLYIDIETVISIIWTNKENNFFNSTTIPLIKDYTEHSFQYHVANFNLSDAGQYKCSNIHDTQQKHNFIQSSDSKYNYINITAISKSFLW